MRYLIHLGLFTGALVAVTSAEAQPHRRADREVTVVVAGHGHPKYHSKKKNKAYRIPPGHAYGHYKFKGKYRLHDERRDLRQIVDISRAWRRATISRDYYWQMMIDRRLEAWIERELYEARRDHHHRHYARLIRDLRRELADLNWRFASGHARRHHYARKSEILNHLVELSERQVYLARAYTRPPTRFSYADYDYYDRGYRNHDRDYRDHDRDYRDRDRDYRDRDDD